MLNPDPWCMLSDLLFNPREKALLDRRERMQGMATNRCLPLPFMLRFIPV
jgi:hypothetical protein